MANECESSSSVLVSIVIVSWNARQFLQGALASLYRETVGVDFETIVVDNGSTDGTVQFVSCEWPQVRLVASPTNLGFTGGNNLGFRHCRGRYILLLNSDTIVLPTTVRGMADFLEQHPEAGCVGCRHLNEDRTLQRSVDNFPSLLNDFVSYTELQRLQFVQWFLHKKFAWWSDHNVMREVDWVNGACMMVRREILDRIGGLDEGYFIYAEEVDWCYRIRKAGWRIYFTPDAEVVHLGGKSMDHVPGWRLVLKYTGQYRFYRKHYALWRQLGLRLLVMTVAAGRITILLAFQAASVFRKSAFSKQLGVITQDPVVTSPGIMIRAWWKVLWLPWPQLNK
jgi:N-acetylglucosaminyl-diphospho-decaprenol L-rhamnosyltransferase